MRPEGQVRPHSWRALKFAHHVMGTEDPQWGFEQDKWKYFFRTVNLLALSRMN